MRSKSLIVGATAFALAVVLVVALVVGANYTGVVARDAAGLRHYHPPAALYSAALLAGNGVGKNHIGAC